MYRYNNLYQQEGWISFKKEAYKDNKFKKASNDAVIYAKNLIDVSLIHTALKKIIAILTHLFVFKSEYSTWKLNEHMPVGKTVEAHGKFHQHPPLQRELLSSLYTAQSIDSFQ